MKIETMALDLHLALYDVSVALLATCLPLPSFSLAFYSSAFPDQYYNGEIVDQGRREGNR